MHYEHLTQEQNVCTYNLDQKSEAMYIMSSNASTKHVQFNSAIRIELTNHEFTHKITQEIGDTRYSNSYYITSSYTSHLLQYP